MDVCYFSLFSIGPACTLLPSARLTIGLRITSSPALMPSRNSTSVPKSRATVTLRNRAMPFSITTTCKPRLLNTSASAGTITEGDLQGICKANLQLNPWHDDASLFGPSVLLCCDRPTGDEALAQ